MPAGPATRRKQLPIDGAVLAALEALARDHSRTLEALADEAFRDLLKKHKRPLTLRQALRDSARAIPANDPAEDTGRVAGDGNADVTTKPRRRKPAPKG